MGGARSANARTATGMRRPPSSMCVTASGSAAGLLRAAEACTATADAWWATRSCSTRAMLSRSSVSRARERLAAGSARRAPR